MSLLGELDEQVAKFATAAGQTVNRTPVTPSREDRHLSTELVFEEIGELDAALANVEMDIEDYHTGMTFYDGKPEVLPPPAVSIHAELADSIADIIWVLIRLAQTYGIDIVSVMAAVNIGNQSKIVNGTVEKRADGKVLKPATWIDDKPLIREIIEAGISAEVTETRSWGGAYRADVNYDNEAVKRIQEYFERRAQ